MGILFAFSKYALFLCLCVSESRCHEPKCSAFDYEEKLLEKMVKMEFEVKRSISEMQSFKEDMKANLEDLQEERKKLREEIDGFRKSQDEVNRKSLGKIELQESDLSRLYEDVNSIRNSTAMQTNERRVEFRAHAVKDNTLANGQRIVFSTVEMNEGQGYDSNTGYFTAPVAGTYLLMVQLCIVPPNYIFLDIVVDDITKNAFQASGYHFNYCVTWTDIAVMETGSKAGVVSRSDRSGKNVFKQARHHQNSFSGILLYEQL